MKKSLTVKELKELIADLPDEMKIYIVSDDEMPIRTIVGVSSEIKKGFYSELYLNTE